MRVLEPEVFDAVFSAEDLDAFAPASPTCPARASVAGRTDQLLAVALWPVTTKHRSRSSISGPLKQVDSAYPLGLQVVLACKMTNCAESGATLQFRTRPRGGGLRVNPPPSRLHDNPSGTPARTRGLYEISRTPFTSGDGGSYSTCSWSKRREHRISQHQPACESGRHATGRGRRLAVARSGLCDRYPGHR